MPRCRVSATFSAACRQTLQVRKSASPSFQSPAWRSKNRGVDAMRKDATAWPLGVKRRFGSSTRFPTIVITVSPAMGLAPAGVRAEPGSVDLGADDLGTEDRLAQVELPVELLDRGRLSRQVDHRVDAFGLLLDVVRQAPPAPDVDLLDAAAAVLDDLQERVERRVRGALVDAGVEDRHQ